MQWLDALILGLVQGLTEFIPISSSGHLVIVQTLLSGASDHLFLEFINVGTLAALLVFFRAKIANIFKDIFVDKKYRLARNILITAIPAGVIGYVSAGFIERTPFFTSVSVVAVALLIVGIVMVVAEKLPHAKEVKDGEHLSGWRAFIIGLVQMLALIPGVSRSGATILAGRFSGLKPAEAAEYSFLVSLPLMIGVTLKVLASDHAYLLAHLPTLAFSNAVAFMSGLFAVGFLMRYLQKHSLAAFGWYRIALAVVLIIVLLLQ
ncbi:MAG: undecaprenyl-diphosphate phosphatase [Candidatus Saccharimonadales bacterium]